MEDRIIRPSMKRTWAAYTLALVLAVAADWAILTYAPDAQPWVLTIPWIAVLWPLKLHLKARLMTLRLHDDHLTLESGFLSRTRRTVDMAKIQDVTVRQTVGQRLAGVGDIMLESAGESGAMAIQNVDRPRELADEIIGSSKRALTARARGGL
jgi:uncharacterized membrane protein YdbT with pleckstrin-like domain